MSARRWVRAAAVAGGASAIALMGAVPAAHAVSTAPKTTPSKVELVLDASGSMAEPAGDGKTKIDAARTSLIKVVDGLPKDAHTGMRVYGANQPGNKDTPAACSDSQQVVPIGTDNKKALRSAIRRYEPKGQTPTAYALEKAAKDLGTTGPRTVVLVSDGEATCQKDPCKTAQALAKKGINLHIDVVGLKVGSDARKQLQCVADSGNGTYYDATDTKSLTNALQAAQIAAEAPFRPEGKKVTGTPSTSGAPALTAGSYVDAMPTSKKSLDYYRLHHTIPGSTMWVGVTTQMKHGLFSTLTAAVRAEHGDTCSSDNTVHKQLQSLVVSSYAPDVSGCASGQDQYLTVSGKPDQIMPGQQVQITVVEEPPATGARTAADIKPLDHAMWHHMTPAGKAAGLPAVTSLDAAPKVKSGTYSLKLAPASLALVKVHLDWGQSVQAVASVRPESASSWGFDTIVDVDLLSPLGGSVSDVLAPSMPTAHSRASGNSNSYVPATMRKVDYANRNSGLSWVMGAARPGDYYVAVSRDTLGASSKQRVLDVQLQIETFGKRGVGAPTYKGSTGESSAAATSSPASAAPSSSGAATAATRAAEPVEHASTEKNWPLIGGVGVGALALLAIGAAAVRALRRG